MITRTVLFVGALTLAGTAQAALHDRGGGLIYDDVLNVTWLQDANYAKTSGYDADGQMSWHQASAWANGLVYGGFDDWRLAKNNPINGVSYQNIPSTDTYAFYAGTGDRGYNVSSVNSELGYMFFVNFGNNAAYDTNGNLTGCYPRCFLIQSAIDPESGNTINFLNLRLDGAGGYWSESEFTQNGYNLGFYFDVGVGFQGTFSKSQASFASWAVRDGDVAAIPEPETYGMFLAGLGLITLMGQRKAS